jgi:hypothetical protein
MDLTTQPLWNYSVRYVLVLMELRSRRVVHVAVTAYITYYNGGRPHQGIEGIPDCGPGLPRETRPGTDDSPIRFVARPAHGGLHHDYRLAA